MNQEDIDELRKVLNDFEIGRANKHLRKIFIIYLQSEHENLPIDFTEVLIDLEQLFDMLDLMESWNKSKDFINEQALGYGEGFVGDRKFENFYPTF